ncbi:MAG: hypothetical protein IJ801_02265 [Lachnospiraceae bacterium]|nr:hypothetical protein [Lachnospiraceae bacterium]
MEDENAIYVLLGSELQGKVNYGMPVKDVLYDAIGYSKQIEEARRSYRKDEKTDDESHDEAELLVKDGTLKIRLTSEEFLSGWRKGEKSDNSYHNESVRFFGLSLRNPPSSKR